MFNCGVNRVMSCATSNIIKIQSESIVTMNELDSCEFIKLAEDLCLVKMGSYSKLYLQGVVKVYGINCVLKVYGRLVNPGYPLNIYNCFGASVIYIETGTPTTSIDFSQIRNYLHVDDNRKFKVFQETVEKYASENNLFLLSSENSRYSYINEALKQNSIPCFPDVSKCKGLPVFYEAENHLQCLFDHKLGDRIDRKLVIDPSWNQLLEIENLDEERFQERIMICGGKGFGKSTLLRYLINKSQEDKINPILIDFDPGQPETNLPGCISYSIVSDPLMGPAYTHLQRPRWCSYVGEVNVDKNVNKYLQSVLNLSYALHHDQFLKPKSDLFIINTMGYSRGTGVLFQCAIVRAMRPTKLIILESQLNELRANNFSEELLNNSMTSEVLDQMNYPNDKFNCKVIRIRAPADLVYKNPKYKENSLKSWQLRRAMQICYFLNANKNLTLRLNDQNEKWTKRNDWQKGDIVVLSQKCNTVLNCLGFGQVLSFDRNECLLRIRTQEYLVKEFDNYAIVIEDVISGPRTPSQWRSMDIYSKQNNTNVKLACALYSIHT